MKIVFILVYLGDERQLERQSHDSHRIRFTVALRPNPMYDLFDRMLFQLGLPERISKVSPFAAGGAKYLLDCEKTCCSKQKAEGD